MSRNILIGNKKTFDDWGLILTNQSIGYPEPKTNYIDIPHGDGSLDLTQALTGGISYSNRKGSFSFDLIETPSERSLILNEITQYIHGRVHEIVLPDEPLWIYKTRLSINGVQTSYLVNKLVLNVVSEPYKYKKNVTKYNVVLNSLVNNRTLHNEGISVIPKITTNAEITIEFDSSQFIIGQGTFILPKLKLLNGDNNLQISGGVGTIVKFEYQERIL